MVFYSPGIGGGGSQTNKAGYSPTIICGSNAAGEALPPHFQLKTTAKDVSRERFNIGFLLHAKNINAQFGHEEVTSLPCTVGMNDRAGMNAEELDKYFHKSILPLFPDIADVDGKRVIAKVDSGPGRMNLPMLASLKLKGLYLAPGLPNSTGKTQETDQNYTPFKTYYRGNLVLLVQSRFDMKKTITINDLPLIVFGGKDFVTGITLQNAFELAFNEEQCLSAWRKCGAVPLTRSVLNSPDIRHEVLINANGTVNESMDPHGFKLMEIEQSNHQACDFLMTFGFDGSQFRMDAPKRSVKKYKLTEPHSKERIKAIQKASTAGKMFHATHGQHLNLDDFFEARAKTTRDKEIIELEKEKSHRLLLKTKGNEVRALLERKGEPTEATLKNFSAEEMILLASWKSGKKAKGKKADLLTMYEESTAPSKPLAWSNEEEERLTHLKTAAIMFQDTEMNTALKQSANAVKTNASKLSDVQAADLLDALNKRTATVSNTATRRVNGECHADL